MGASADVGVGGPSETKTQIASSTAGTEELRQIGRYLLLRRIARGGMGEVFLASTTGIEGAERPVVVKIIRREHATDPSFLARFLDEARVQAQLSHSGVAQVLDATLDDTTGEPYVVVEYVEGRSLGDMRARGLQTGARIGWADGVAVATLIAEALAHVHERQDSSGRALAIVHRDLSPQNVMVGYAGDVKIIDFGTARGQNRRCHTVAGVVFAKPGYVAPEVANGDPGDARVDLYALGVMLWELCASKRFLQGEASEHMAAVAKNAQNPPPIAVACGAPIELDAIIAKLTVFERDARYLAARTVAADLARLLGSAPPLASGERGVRARVAELMRALFPNEPAKSRREFARLAGTARAAMALSAPASTTKTAPRAEAPTEEDGVLPGTRYKLIREIGRGASSVVWEAEQLDLARRVALKVQASQDAGAAERMVREARALGRLRHDAIVELYDAGTTPDGRRWAAMQLLEGETLESHLAREKGCSVREALRIATDVLGALEAVHAEGFVHRDVKPANVMLCLSGGIKLLDFGLARDASAGAEQSRLAEMTLFGTPEYMAPEQSGGGSVDGRADVYALGCVLYEMITGRVPFVSEGAVGILDAKRKGSPERPRDRAPARGVPRDVDDLVMRALARHPSVRFQSAAGMRAGVLAALDAPARRRSGRRALGFASLALAMGFAGVLLAGKAGDVWQSMRTTASPLMGPFRTAPVAAAAPAVEPMPDELAAAEADGEPEMEADGDEDVIDLDLDVAPNEEEHAAADDAVEAPAPTAPVASPARGTGVTPPGRTATRRKVDRRRVNESPALAAAPAAPSVAPSAAPPVPPTATNAGPAPLPSVAPALAAADPPSPTAGDAAVVSDAPSVPAPAAEPASPPPAEPVTVKLSKRGASGSTKPPAARSSKVKKNTPRKKPKSRRAQK